MHRWRIDTLFHVPTIMRGVCVAALAAAVRTIDDAAQVKADLEARTVRVLSNALEATLLQILGEAGFTAEPILQPLE